MRRIVGCIALGIGLALTDSLAAQSKAVELGLDGALSVYSGGGAQLGIPFQRFRVGFIASERVEIEPAIALNWLKPSEGNSVATINGGLGVLVHLAADAEKARPYLRPFVGFNLLTGGGESLSQFEAGAGLGVKAPITSVAKFAFRLEAGYVHGFEGDFGASDRFQLLFGLSLFTK
jgi:hypothetical protein